MSTSEQVVVEITRLPETQQREVLDFIRFLKTRRGLTESENMMFAIDRAVHNDPSDLTLGRLRVSL